MKTVGFLQKHEKRVLGNVIDYDEVKSNTVAIGTDIFHDVLRYLAEGVYIYGMPLALEDKGKIVGPYIVYSDGEWIWPEYYSYYIMSGEIETIPTEFLARMKDNKFKVPEIPDVKEIEAKNYFMGLLLRNNPNYHKK